MALLGMNSTNTRSLSWDEGHTVKNVFKKKKKTHTGYRDGRKANNEARLSFGWKAYSSQNMRHSYE